ncbi:MAG: NAD-dependent epimerase/dehydratase family protein [Lentimicrobium sp.]|jgi:nucleoside-diphosphate-sugar epimerase|nr:NAD-dependent epimerase/dehydratase family protein [Lentimicrobium sp.]
MQTIIGSGGAIGIELAKALTEYTTDIRLVSRNPKRVNPTDKLLPADITSYNELEKAVKGSDVVYVTVGFPYNHKVWEELWPKFIRDLISVCKNEKCKLVFFDNIYMYDKDHLNGMTEETPINPPGKKGKTRAKIAQMIIDEINAGNLKALIARSADFYGPSIRSASVLTETVLKTLSKNKKANWLESVNYQHSFTFTVDAGKATAILGNTDSAYGQVWHLPTASNPLTGKQWIEKIAQKLDVKPKYQVAPKFLVRILGLFNPIMRESVEMLYQYDRDYIFDSGKFEKEFNFTPTAYEKGIDIIIKTDYIKTTANK